MSKKCAGVHAWFHLFGSTFLCRCHSVVLCIQIQKEVHPSLLIKDDALSYIETFIIQMLSMLCAGQPHTVADVEDRVQKKIPHPIDRWAISDAHSAIGKDKEKKNKKTLNLALPVDKLHQTLIKVEFPGHRSCICND